MRARWTRASPAPEMTLSLVMRPCARSRCGQSAYSSAEIGPKSIWQASDDTGVKRPSASTSAATPSPVPGPRITWGPSDPNLSGPMRRSHPSGIVGNDNAWASKSLSSKPWARPVRRAASGPSITQGALVSLSVRPTTGPAPQAIAERGLAPSLGTAASIACAKPRIIAGVQVDNVAEATSRFADQREAHVGAAGVADESWKGEGEVGHGGHKRKRPGRWSRACDWVSTIGTKLSAIRSNKRRTNVDSNRPQKIAISPQTPLSCLERQRYLMRATRSWHDEIHILEFFAGGGMARAGLGDSWRCSVRQRLR